MSKTKSSISATLFLGGLIAAVLVGESYPLVFLSVIGAIIMGLLWWSLYMVLRLGGDNDYY